MNSLMKKMLIFLLVMTMVAAAGWYGRKAYKRATERRALTEAGRYLEKKDLRNAELCLKRALQVNPMSAPASTMMADLLESAHVPAALGWRIRAAQLQPDNITNRLAWAQTAIQLGDLKSAGDALGGQREPAGTSAAYPRYQKLSGALAWGLGKRDEAEKHYREALRLEPGNPSIVLNLDTIGLASTNAEVAAAARASLERVATNSEFRAVALRYLMADAVEHKSIPRAKNYSAEIVRDPAATAGDKINYLELLHVAGDASFSSWLASIKQEAAHSPVEAFALGKWMATAENPTNALRWLQTLPQSIQTNQPVPLVMADCYIALKDWKGLVALAERQDWGEANCFRLALVSLGERSMQQEPASQTAWRKALRLASHRLDRLSRLSQAAAGWGWQTESTEILKEIVAEFPKEKWATDQLATRLYAAGNTRELGDLVAKIYAADTSDARSKNNLANIFLLEKADLDKAYRLAREAYDSSPGNPFFASTYAYSLLLQKKPEEALKVSSGIKPEFLQIPSVAAYYGVVQAQSGHKDTAKAPLERAAAAKLLPEENEMVRLAKASL